MARILIVEDELISAENFKEILEGQGYQVAGVVTSGENAIDKLSVLNPDLILMDIRLEGSLDGIQTAIMIHSTIKEIPILFLTAHAEDQFPHMAAVDHSLFRYLAKPCKPEDLISSIKTLLSGDSQSSPKRRP